MERYRRALVHLNAALDIMVEQGDTGAIANIAYPIALLERSIVVQQADVIRHQETTLHVVPVSPIPR